MNLNVRPKTIKLLEENIGSEISNIFLSDCFSDMSPWARESKVKINKWDYNTPKGFLQQRKRQPTE